MPSDTVNWIRTSPTVTSAAPSQSILLVWRSFLGSWGTENTATTTITAARPARIHITGRHVVGVYAVRTPPRTIPDPPPTGAPAEKIAKAVARCRP